jgi:hypothetical protein
MLVAQYEFEAEQHFYRPWFDHVDWQAIENNELSI